MSRTMGRGFKGKARSVTRAASGWADQFQWPGKITITKSGAGNNIDKKSIEFGKHKSHFLDTNKDKWGYSNKGSNDIKNKDNFKINQTKTKKINIGDFFLAIKKKNFLNENEEEVLKQRVFGKSKREIIINLKIKLEQLDNIVISIKEKLKNNLSREELAEYKIIIETLKEKRISIKKNASNDYYKKLVSKKTFIH